MRDHVVLCVAKSGPSNLPPMVLGPVHRMRRRATGPVSYQTQTQNRPEPTIAGHTKDTALDTSLYGIPPPRQSAKQQPALKVP